MPFDTFGYLHSLQDYYLPDPKQRQVYILRKWPKSENHMSLAITNTGQRFSTLQLHTCQHLGTEILELGLGNTGGRGWAKPSHCMHAEGTCDAGGV